MRIFLSVLILIFGLQSWTKADNIKDFEIEGMSVGDSLLNYYSDNKIQDNKMNYLEGKRNFYVVGMDDGSNLYDNIEFYLKTGDKKFLIYGISAGIFYRDNYNQCEKKKDKIVREIKDIFKQSKMSDWGSFSHTYDKSGLSKQTAVSFNVERGAIRVECVNWSEKITKENNWIDNLSVSAISHEVTKWIDRGYP
tara:strand:+ start:824 stop:1405 length:582 start_codon:yes stop_codon:yes gene_type:complete